MINMRSFGQGQNLRAYLTGVYRCIGAGNGLVNATNKWESYCEHKKVYYIWGRIFGDGLFYFSLL